jgi:hypothetical protein
MLEERGLPRALSDRCSAGRERRENVMLVCVFFNIGTLDPPIKKIKYLSVDFFHGHKEKARAPRTKIRHINPSPRQRYSACWRRRHTLKKVKAGSLW